MYLVAKDPSLPKRSIDNEVCGHGWSLLPTKRQAFGSKSLCSLPWALQVDSEHSLKRYKDSTSLEELGIVGSIDGMRGYHKGSSLGYRKGSS